MVSLAAEYRLLRILQGAGAQGIGPDGVASKFWPGKESAKKHAVKAVAGRMLGELVAKGYVTRIAGGTPLYLLEKAGAERIEEIARQESEQAAIRAAGAPRARRGELSEQSSEGGPWF